MLSSRAKYALRALIVLAEAGPKRPVAASVVAARAAVPPRFLEQILWQLRQAGLVSSRRGRHGGYTLTRAPQAVSFGEVIRLTDGPVAPLPCLSRSAYRKCPECPDEAACRIRRTFAAVAEATRDVLDHTTVADAAEVGASAVEFPSA